MQRHQALLLKCLGFFFEALRLGFGMGNFCYLRIREVLLVECWETNRLFKITFRCFHAERKRDQLFF